MKNTFGKLTVVATPIGNMSDISPRAIEALQTNNFIICEDTRVTGNLLKKYEIKNEMLSCNAHTESKKIPYIIERLKNGENAALVSDAGTPCISDPGVRLVSALIDADIEVFGIPGPNAAILALSISGLPTDAFVFEGFLPQKKGRQKKLTELASEPRTIVLYESTYRIEKFLTELNQYMPERYVVVCRELTKMFEETWRGLPAEIIADFKNKTTKGEFVVVIGAKNFSKV